MHPYIALFFTKLLLVLAGLIPIVNPLGAAPIFLSMTARYTSAERAVLARRIGIYCFCLLLGSMFVGTYVLDFFGVSLPIVRVCGGLLVAAAGWKLLNDSNAGDSSEPIGDATETIETPQRRDELRQRAFFPLSFPFTVGPGSITVAITLGVGIHDESAHRVVLPLASVAGVAVVALIVYLVDRYADKALSLIGRTGTVVFMRLSAFILLCLGAQILWDGASGLAGDFIATHPWATH
ncbi:MarC family protein [Amantichitinum ursilacus]|uniref:UPF0056 membrane protein n=1 Tax=Amantichitinum ursilacus TaxID=857265 RepID=A0A0N0XHT4_9NEIS|nr:MarC family protein [Amantichitinum ursilacus]KPC49369.1 inner membrane protein [Amantichitinum ursilacus]